MRGPSPQGRSGCQRGATSPTPSYLVVLYYVSLPVTVLADRALPGGHVLEQSEADRLLDARKWFSRTVGVIDLHPGVEQEYRLRSSVPQEVFHLDVRRNSVRLSKVTYQHRVRVEVRLARLDLGGSPHRNPPPNYDRIPTPHLHLYREGYGDKWAYPLGSFDFVTDPTDYSRTLREFCDWCNIDGVPGIQEGAI